MKRIMIFFVFILLCISFSFSIFAKEKKDLSGEYFYIAESYAELKKYEKAMQKKK